VRQLYVNDPPLRRLETPEDVAGSIVFLASPASDFITGEAININGGLFME
jgi:meso-butanediol dehydrogenase/(S,S)-butanediol dehydrogenase/diacetyl reductase